MFSHPLRASLPIVLLIALVLVLASSNTTQVSAGSGRCHKVEGTVVMGGPAVESCSSKAGGTIGGGLVGTFCLTVTSMQPNPAFRVIRVQQTAVFDVEGGTLMTDDATVLQVLNDAGDFRYTEVNTIIGGTGDYENAAGILKGFGTGNFAASAGTYSGQICYR